MSRLLGKTLSAGRAPWSADRSPPAQGTEQDNEKYLPMQVKQARAAMDTRRRWSSGRRVAFLSALAIAVASCGAGTARASCGDIASDIVALVDDVVAGRVAAPPESDSESSSAGGSFDVLTYPPAPTQPPPAEPWEVLESEVDAVTDDFVQRQLGQRLHELRRATDAASCGEAEWVRGTIAAGNDARLREIAEQSVSVRNHAELYARVGLHIRMTGRHPSDTR